MAEIPTTPGTDVPEKTADKKLRERVDKLLAQSAVQSTGGISLGGHRLEYDVSAAFLPVVSEGFEGAHGEPQAAVMLSLIHISEPTRPY